MGIDRLTASAVKARARELHFDLCGANGYAATMGWMYRSAERRTDVRQVLPGARSVIVTGTLYNTDRPYSSALGPDIARISRYAWGDDYHDVLQERLDRLLSWLREESADAFEARAYVDTGPVQERVYAQYAGLGWIGKNTCLINAELGSWLFLGEIITTLDLEADTQGLEQCGSCTKCLDACPTDALVEPGVLDSARCLSYLTIEHRGDIPVDYHDAMHTHVYGCDVCQEVCPYNLPAPVSNDAPWQPRAGLDLPRLADLAVRTDDQLRMLVKGTPMTRAKVAGLRRNLEIAVQNSKG